MPNEQTWPDLAIGLYDKLTGRHAEITYDFENMEISIPAGTSSEAGRALWRFNGILKVRTSEHNNGQTA